jgi:hypothetical protein
VLELLAHFVVCVRDDISCTQAYPESEIEALV